MVRVRDFLCLPSPMYEIRTTRFFISPVASFMFLTAKDKIWIYAEAIDAVGAHGQRF